MGSTSYLDNETNLALANMGIDISFLQEDSYYLPLIHFICTETQNAYSWDD